MKEQSEVLVTGASGFVGRRLVARLVEDGIAVRAVISGRREVAPFGPGVQVHHWDASNSAASHELVSGVTGVCHVAAFLPPSYGSSAFARACLSVNALAALSLAEAAAHAGIRRFVLFSTGNAYRASPISRREDDPLYPSARAPYYLASKLCGEIFTSHFGELGLLDVCVLRPTAIYGPSMPEAGLLPLFAKRLRDGQPIDVADGGRAIVDLVHVDDVVSAARAALTSDATGAFNIGSGKATTVLEIAEMLAAILGADSSLIRVAPPTGPVSAGFSTLDVTRAREHLGYEPRDLRRGIEDYVRNLTGAL